MRKGRCDRAVLAADVQAVSAVEPKVNAGTARAALEKVVVKRTCEAPAIGPEQSRLVHAGCEEAV